MTPDRDDALALRAADHTLSDDFTNGYLAGWEDRNAQTPTADEFFDELTGHDITYTGLTYATCSCGARIPRAPDTWLGHLADVARALAASDR